jgi:hypothetical protein
MMMRRTVVRGRGLTDRAGRIDNGDVLSVLIGRRGVAILASLALVIGCVVPPAHVHLTLAPSGGLEPVGAHQHIQPHRLALADHAALHAADDHHTNAFDDDDDGLLTQSLEQQSALQDSSEHLPILVAPSLALFAVPSALARPRPFPPAAAAALPADPPLSPHGLRAPPAVL